ncbi:uncharacterized protein C9orf85 homolog isoform X1 [Latimeria chalumnae]|uniref:Chromosome 9 open reading frame 85 n=1 Tax=Latimeria chalumnae TaxID=7897 RepID=H3AWK0_LATCH|nr:PREDICTED: uncharacterized protein C9orf85 homolog isoform X1 [Latimeria chalumnae]|eukprot:XP_006001730.1 PREDICTED: uncharacterized protein C9orf85 homolog isoform X1 [Latimeria chalumnae]
MSSQRGNVARRRPQKYQNTTVFKNNKYDTSVVLKKVNAKVHDGVCQRCIEVLEWKVKFKKYKPLTIPKKCVKCLQKTVKDSYRIMCKPCALKLELCAKCGKKEEIVVPLNESQEKLETEAAETGHRKKCKSSRKADDDNDDFDLDSDFDDSFEEEDHQINMSKKPPEQNSSQIDVAQKAVRSHKELLMKADTAEKPNLPDLSEMTLNSNRN